MDDKKLYGLYSQTRRIIYTNNEPFGMFWDKYLMNKYPDDEWTKLDYNNLAKQVLPIVREFNLLNKEDLLSRSLSVEIRQAKEKLAIQMLEDYIFVVLKETPKGGETIVYVGSSAIEAAITFRETFTCNIEVRKHGRMIDTFYDIQSFVEKYIKKIS